MNDFTKEELIKILKAYEMDPHYFDSHQEINNFGGRIQSMIDNYCEHKNTECTGGWTYKCTDCGMKFGDETQ